MYLSRESFLRNKKSNFVLIKDDLKNNGENLLRAILTGLLKEKAEINYLSYDKPPDYVEHVFGESVSVIDAFSDPFLLKKHSTEALKLISPEVFSKLPTDPDSVTVIDSLSTLIVHNSAVTVYQSLHKYLKSSQTIALMHSDVHSAKDCQMIECLATTVLEIQHIEGNNYHLNGIVKFPSGKVSIQNISCQINENHEILSMTEISSWKKFQPTSKHPDPTANLTFNLNLNADEKEVRDKLELPYTKVAESTPTENLGPELAEDDFYEEDDPDDDLDF